MNIGARSRQMQQGGVHDSCDNVISFLYIIYIRIWAGSVYIYIYIYIYYIYTVNINNVHRQSFCMVHIHYLEYLLITIQ